MLYGLVYTLCLTKNTLSVIKSNKFKNNCVFLQYARFKPDITNEIKCLNTMSLTMLYIMYITIL